MSKIIELLGPILARLALIAQIIDTIRQWFGEPPDPADSLFAYHKSHQDILGQLFVRQGDAQTTLDAILAHVQEHLPVGPPPVPPSAGDIAGEVWQASLTLHPYTGAPLNTGQALELASFIAAEEHEALLRCSQNPDFARRHKDYGEAGTYDELDWLIGLNVRSRPAGQTIGDYLAANTPTAWTKQGRHYVTNYAWSQSSGGAPNYIYCLVTDDDYLPSVPDPRIDTLLDRTVDELAANDKILAADWSGVSDPRIDTLLDRTVDELAANDKILAADLGGGTSEPDPRIDELLTRTINTAAADLVILRPAGPHVAGAPIQLGQSGTVDIAGAVALVLQVSNVPAGWGRVDDGPPARYWPWRVGNFALGGQNAFGPANPIEFDSLYIPIERLDITIFGYHLVPPVAGLLYIITRQEA